MNNESDYDKQYPETDFNKKTFSFTSGESRELQSLVTISKMGQVANMMANNFVTGDVMKRLNVKASQDTGCLYDVTKGQVIVYEPKLWCSLCQTKRAEFKFKDKIYCSTCIEVIKNEQLKEVESVKPEAKTKKKVK